jgi:hypothetical protein
MSSPEYGALWPLGIVAQINHYEKEVVCRLYGEETARWWIGRQKHRVVSDLFLDEIIEPRIPFRAGLSDYFRHAELKTHHEVVSVSEADRGVLIEAKFAGKILGYNYDMAIITAGGFNSPLILKRSGIRGAALGLNITDHPMGFVAKITINGSEDGFRALTANFDDLHPFEPMLKIRDSITGLWTAFYLRPTSSAVIKSDPFASSFETSDYRHSFRSAVIRKLAAGLVQFKEPDFRSTRLYEGATIRRHAYVLAFSEQEALGQGNITENEMGDMLLDWNISDDVVSSIDRSLDHLAQWLNGSLTRADGDLRTRLWSAAHHSGACRIAADPMQGVVDENLRVRGAQRIYVCDGSVLPSTGASNTGLTIGSLALRLADYISKALVHEPMRISNGLPTIPVSGASGNLGQMALPALARSGFDPRPISFREGRSSPELRGGDLLLHFANVAGSIEANINLQERVVEFLAAAKIDQIIIPQSFAPLQSPSPKGLDPFAVNFGFGDIKFRDSYILGKLAVEEFWIEWQKEDSDRRIAFLYVPTILGPHSAWTRNIATHCQGQPVWVPTIQPFFSLTEEQLTEWVIRLCRHGLPRGITRRLIFDGDGSLAEAITWDRGQEDVREIDLPSTVRHIILLSKYHLINRILYRLLRLTNKSLRSRWSVLPVAPYYYAIFETQSRFANLLKEAVAQLEYPVSAVDTRKQASGELRS